MILWILFKEICNKIANFESWKSFRILSYVYVIITPWNYCAIIKLNLLISLKTEKRIIILEIRMKNLCEKYEKLNCSAARF